MNNAVRLALTNYAIFRGRTKRRDYWLFWVFTIIISLSTNIIDAAFFPHHVYLESISSVFLFVPSLSVGTRRMHDVGRRGWFLIIPLVNFYFLVQPTGPDNEFGPAQLSQTI